jgi:dihydroxy-acid dehydratase
MATAYEMLGMSPMGWNGIPAMDPRKDEIAFECGKLVMELVRKGDHTALARHARRASRTPSAGVMATGGSTNAVLHLRATAKDFGVKLSIDDFDRISKKTPVLADLKPWGNFTAPEMYEAGGMAAGGQAPARSRAAARRARRLCPGRPSATSEERRRAGGPEGDQAAHRGDQADGGIAILRGNLAPEAA